MPNALQKTTDLLNRMLLRASARVPVKGVQSLVYQSALDVCDFKTLDYLLDNVNISDKDRCNTIIMVAAAHRWVSNGNQNISYESDSYAKLWISRPLHSPHVDATFLINLLKKLIKKPLNNPTFERMMLNNLHVVRFPHISLDLSSNDLILSKMKFSPQVLPFVVIKSLDSYTNTSLRICEISTCDELLRRHFKHIDWTLDLDPEKMLKIPQQYAWKEIVHCVPEPYLLSLIRSHKKLVHDPWFIERVLHREFSYKVWNSMCENGCTSEEIQNVNYVSNPDNMKKALECCEHLAARRQRTRLIKSVEEPQEQEEISPPKKRKM